LCAFWLDYLYIL